MGCNWDRQWKAGSACGIHTEKPEFQAPARDRSEKAPASEEPTAAGRIARASPLPQSDAPTFFITNHLCAPSQTSNPPCAIVTI